MNSGKLTIQPNELVEEKPISPLETPLLSDVAVNNTITSLESNSANCSDIELDEIDSKIEQKK